MSVILNIVSAFDDAGVRKAQRSLGNLGSSAKGFSGSMGADMIKFGTSLERLGGKVSKFGDRMSTRFTLPVVAAFGFATKAAIDEEQEMALLANALRKNTGATDDQVAAVERWITKTQNWSGVADGELRPAMAALLAVTKDTGKAQELMGQALDIAAAKGKDPVIIAEALAKAYNGNIGILSRYGVATKNAAGETLTFDEIMANAAATFGGSAAVAAEKTAGKLAILKAKLQDTAESVGTGLIPLVEQAGAVIGGLADAFNGLSPGMQGFIVKALLAGAAIGPVLSVGGRLMKTAGTLSKALGNVGIAFGKNAKAAPAWARGIAAGARGAKSFAASAAGMLTNLGKQSAAFTVATAKTLAHTAATLAARAAQLAIAGASKAWAAAQWLLNAAMTANPIGLVIAGVAAMVAIFVVAWKKSETFRRIVTGAWEGIKRATRAVFDWIVGFFRRWGPLIIKILIGPIGNLVLQIVKHWDKIRQGAVSAFNAVVDFARSVPGKIKSAVGNLDKTLYGAGADLLRGLWNGMKSISGWLKDKVYSFFQDLLPGWAKKALGIGSPSKVFAEIGRNVAAGMVVGLDAGNRMVADATQRLVGVGAGSGQLALSLAGGGGGGSSAGGSVVIGAGAVVVHLSVGPGVDAGAVKAAARDGVEAALVPLAREIRAQRGRRR